MIETVPLTSSIGWEMHGEHFKNLEVNGYNTNTIIATAMLYPFLSVALKHGKQPNKLNGNVQVSRRHVCTGL